MLCGVALYFKRVTKADSSAFPFLNLGEQPLKCFIGWILFCMWIYVCLYFTFRRWYSFFLPPVQRHRIILDSALLVSLRHPWKKHMLLHMLLTTNAPSERISCLGPRYFIMGSEWGLARPVVTCHPTHLQPSNSLDYLLSDSPCS